MSKKPINLNTPLSEEIDMSLLKNITMRSKYRTLNSSSNSNLNLSLCLDLNLYQDLNLIDRVLNLFDI